MIDAKLTVPDVLPTALAYINFYDRTVDRTAANRNIGWGRIHLFLGENFEDHHLQYCVDYAQEIGDAEGEALARMILHLSQTQRRKLYRKMEAGWILLF